MPEIEKEKPSLTMNHYQLLAMRTKTDYDTKKDELFNAALGICGEAGEFADLVKKWAFQGAELDEEHLKKEAGDVLWYIALASDALHCAMGEIAEGNIEKLEKRYPNGFDVARSENRQEGDV